MATRNSSRGSTTRSTLVLNAAHGHELSLRLQLVPDIPQPALNSSYTVEEIRADETVHGFYYDTVTQEVVSDDPVYFQGRLYEKSTLQQLTNYGSSSNVAPNPNGVGTVPVRDLQSALSGSGRLTTLEKEYTRAVSLEYGAREPRRSRYEEALTHSRRTAAGDANAALLRRRREEGFSNQLDSVRIRLAELCVEDLLQQAADRGITVTPDLQHDIESLARRYAGRNHRLANLRNNTVPDRRAFVAQDRSSYTLPVMPSIGLIYESDDDDDAIPPVLANPTAGAGSSQGNRSRPRETTLPVDMLSTPAGIRAFMGILVFMENTPQGFANMRDKVNWFRTHNQALHDSIGQGPLSSFRSTNFPVTQRKFGAAYTRCVQLLQDHSNGPGAAGEDIPEHLALVRRVQQWLHLNPSSTSAAAQQRQRLLQQQETVMGQNEELGPPGGATRTSTTRNNTRDGESTRDVFANVQQAVGGQQATNNQQTTGNQQATGPAGQQQAARRQSNSSRSSRSNSNNSSASNSPMRPRQAGLPGQSQLSAVQGMQQVFNQALIVQMQNGLSGGQQSNTETPTQIRARNVELYRLLGTVHDENVRNFILQDIRANNQEAETASVRAQADFDAYTESRRAFSRVAMTAFNNNNTNNNNNNA